MKSALRKRPSEVDSVDRSLQNLVLPASLGAAEGLAFSASGDTLAVASLNNAVFLFRRRANGQFETTPFRTIGGPESRLAHLPHGVAFGCSGDGELLAVAQRLARITIYRNANDGAGDDLEPVSEICGPQSRLKWSDALAFVPSDDDYLAASSLETNSVFFYRKARGSRVRFELEPVFELRHPSLAHPDGLAFSRFGEWLAVANHRNHCVSIFRRRRRMFAWRTVEYGPEPVTVIADPGLRHPHSVAFSPETNHLAVTNSGANYFSIYAPIGDARGTRWTQSPVVQAKVCPDAVFGAVNSDNPMEGGPKGIAIHRDELAICSPQCGVRIYSLRALN